MISSLSLKNWRTHTDTTVQFGKGTNLIIGIMGSGKSGLLDGLSYALFGTFPSAKRREISAMDAISHGESEAEVSVVFEHEGKRYRVVRKLRKKDGKLSAAAKFYEGITVLDTGQARVTEMVSSLLGMDYELFTRAVYSEQNNIDYFLTIDPGRRKKEMDRLLGLDRFETARAATVSILNRVSSETEAISSSFSPKEYTLLKTEQEEKKKKMDSLGEKRKESEKELSGIKEAVSPLSKQVSTLEEAGKKRDLAKTSLERTKAKLEVLSSELKGKEPSKERLDKLKENLSALSKQKESLTTELRSMEKEFSTLSTNSGKLSSLTETAKSSKNSLSRAEKELSSLLSGKTPESLKALSKQKEEEVVQISSKIESTSSEISELNDVSATLKPGHSECPLCGTDITADKKEHILKEKKEKSESKSKELLTLKEILPKTKKEHIQILESIRKAEHLTDRISDFKSKAEKLPELEKKKSETENKLKEFREKKEELNSKREKIEKEYSDSLLRYKEEESLLKKSESFKSLEEECTKSKALVDSIKFNETELTESRKKLEDSRIKEEKTNSELLMLKKEHATLTESLELIEKSISRMEKARKDTEYLLKLKEELTLYKNSLLDLQSELRAEMTGAISAAMNSIWPVLYPYADYKQIRITATEKDYFFEVYDGEWRKLEKVASGGERACLSLTLRMALSTVLTPNIGWMMLDEPTHNLDKDAVHTLSEALENKVPEIIPQSIVITHEENLISSEFARSYKFSRDKEKLGPTVIESL